MPRSQRAARLLGGTARQDKRPPGGDVFGEAAFEPRLLQGCSNGRQSGRRVGPARLTRRCRASTRMCERPGQTENTGQTKKDHACP
jgi:hypothetical protein